MRLSFAAIVLIGLPAVVTAQSPLPAPGAVPALPSIGLPLPSIGLPLPALGLPPVIDTHPRGRDDHPTRGPGNHRPRDDYWSDGRSGPSMVYFIPTYGWGAGLAGQMMVGTAAVPAATVVAQRPEPSTGRLRLDVQPVTLVQLYVDGYYVGTPADVNGELELEAGPHTLEIRASGYETLAFEVRIVAQRSITYRGALKAIVPETRPVPTAPSLPEATKSVSGKPMAPTTIYFIPGCYLGNVPPAQLTPTVKCDLSQLITRQP